MFKDDSSCESDVAIVDLLEKNNIMTKEVRGLKRKHEIQLVIL